MVQSEVACPKCKHQMQEGFPLDRGDARVGEWVEGPPQYGWLGVKWVRRKRLPITGYRCPSCGYLETYARPK
jgi:Zn ribbon nucleic-acid-binding protein